MKYTQAIRLCKLFWFSFLFLFLQVVLCSRLTWNSVKMNLLVSKPVSIPQYKILIIMAFTYPREWVNSPSSLIESGSCTWYSGRIGLAEITATLNLTYSHGSLIPVIVAWASKQQWLTWKPAPEAHHRVIWTEAVVWNLREISRGKKL